MLIWTIIGCTAVLFIIIGAAAENIVTAINRASAAADDRHHYLYDLIKEKNGRL